MDEESNIIKDREVGKNYAVLGDSQIRDLGIKLSNIRKFRTRKKVVICCPGADIDFSKFRIQVAHGSG